MEVTLEQVAGQIAGISKQLSGFDERVTTAVDDLKHQAVLNMEALKQEVKSAGEGYGATLEGIERQLVELNKKFDTNSSDRDSILTDHSIRITTLEQRS